MTRFIFQFDFVANLFRAVPMSDGDGEIVIGVQCNLPGTRADALYQWEVPSFDDLEGAFAVQEYIQHLIREYLIGNGMFLIP